MIPGEALSNTSRARKLARVSDVVNQLLTEQAAQSRGASQLVLNLRGTDEVAQVVATVVAESI